MKDSSYKQNLESKSKKDPKEDIQWYNIKLFDIQGRGWKNIKEPFTRLPAKAKKMVNEDVYRLSRCSSGMCFDFITNAVNINVKWTLNFKELAMPHFCANGVSGVDLYVKDDSGSWRWLAVAKTTNFPENNSVIRANIEGNKKREYRMYLPNYNSLESLFLGFSKGTFVSKAKPRSTSKKSIVFYGTSITQGASASRAGMPHVAQLGRFLDREIINLGFSGKGRMEPELATLLTELDPELFVIDCLPNLSSEEVAERVVPFVDILRKIKLKTHILLIDTPTYPNLFILKDSREETEKSRKNLKIEYKKLLAKKYKNIHYLSGKKFYGDDGEATVDGIHPSDLGYVRMAKIIESKIKKIINI